MGLAHWSGTSPLCLTGRGGLAQGPPGKIPYTPGATYDGATAHRLSSRPRLPTGVAHRFTGHVHPCAHCRGLIPCCNPSMKQKNLSPLRSPRSTIRFLRSTLSPLCTNKPSQQSMEQPPECHSSSSSRGFIHEPLG
jgi:hypothetical protein